MFSHSLPSKSWQKNLPTRYQLVFHQLHFYASPLPWIPCSRAWDEPGWGCACHANVFVTQFVLPHICACPPCNPAVISRGQGLCLLTLVQHHKAGVLIQGSRHKWCVIKSNQLKLDSFSPTLIYELFREQASDSFPFNVKLLDVSEWPD